MEQEHSPVKPCAAHHRPRHTFPQPEKLWSLSQVVNELLSVDPFEGGVRAHLSEFISE